MTHDPYFYVPSAVSGAEIEITGDDGAHLSKVRRAQPGQRVNISDGQGAVFEAEIRHVEPGAVRVMTSDPVRVPALKPKIRVLQALTKHDKLELVITKLTELNVTGIDIFRAERSIPRWSADKEARAEQRWRSLAVEAAKQSRRPWLPETSGLLTFEQACHTVSRVDRVVVAHDRESTSLREALPDDASDISIVIGPEGGLSDQELTKLVEAGATPVSLGPTILRTETAGIAAVCMVMFRYGLMG